ncbi:MAG: hypothetical protein QGF23_00545, partial [Dehalococcoidales bacterium]|nr:hypothetical protein [Dehalococcoidales bacterium]
FITHDRTLIRQIANKIIEVKDGNLQVITGNYDDYLNWKESSGEEISEISKVSTPLVTGKSAPNNRPRPHKRIEGELRNKYYRESTPTRKRIAEIETELAELEIQFREVESLFSDKDHYEYSAQITATIEKHHRLKKSISSLTQEWERLSIELERMKREFEKAKSTAET